MTEQNPDAPAPRDQPQPASIPRSMIVSTVGIFVILLLGVLFYARTFVLPIVLAALVALTFAPVVRVLGRKGLPSAVSAILVFVVLGLATVGMSAVLSGPIARTVEDAPAIAAEVRKRFDPLTRPLTMLSQLSHEVERMTDGVEAADGQQEVVIARPGLISWISGALADIGSTLAATLLLTPFFLASRNSLRQKVVRIRPTLSGQKQALQVFNDVENEISRFLLTIATINAGLGVMVGLMMAILGMPNPLLWGVGAALLNFIPFAGATVGIALAAAVALVTKDGLVAAALPPLGYVALQFVEGSFVTPMALGRRLDLNIVAILIALALTTWMWGIIGALIGVPILVVLKVFADQLPDLEPLRILLSSNGGGSGDDRDRKPNA